MFKTNSMSTNGEEGKQEIVGSMLKLVEKEKICVKFGMSQNYSGK